MTNRLLNSHIAHKEGKTKFNVIVSQNPDESNPEVLEMHNVTEKDEGWYTCIVQNAMGEAFSSAYLRVVDSKYRKYNYKEYEII